MLPLPANVNPLLIFIAIFGLLVFVHELGHFLSARLFKIHVDEFAIGFPPRVIGLVRGQTGRWRFIFGPRAPKPEELGGPRTIYSLNLLPIGGFVRMRGEDDPKAAGGFASSSKTARAVTLAAGSTFNLLFAFVIFVVGFRLGWPDRVAVTEVAPGSPAEAVGLLPDDVIMRAGGQDVHYTQQLSQIVYASLGAPLEVVVDRGGETRVFIVRPRTLDEIPPQEGAIGITMGQTMVTDYTWPEAVARAGQEIGLHFRELINLPGRLISGQLPWQIARPIGVVGLNDLTAIAVERAQEQQALFPVLDLIGLISVALAITNLLPIPALDGGRILFVIIELVRGRRIDPAREGMVHFVGIVMMLALMVVVTYQDIVNPIFSR